MTYEGRIENGVVVLEHGARLPEGSLVRVEPLPQPAAAGDPLKLRQLRDGLLAFSGVVKGGAPDLARNHAGGPTGDDCAI